MHHLSLYICTYHFGADVALRDLVRGLAGLGAHLGTRGEVPARTTTTSSTSLSVSRCSAAAAAATSLLIFLIYVFISALPSPPSCSRRLRGPPDDVDLAGDGLGGQGVVARHHDDTHARLLAAQHLTTHTTSTIISILHLTLFSEMMGYIYPPAFPQDKRQTSPRPVVCLSVRLSPSFRLPVSLSSLLAVCALTASGTPGLGGSTRDTSPRKVRPFISICGSSSLYSSSRLGGYWSCGQGRRREGERRLH